MGFFDFLRNTPEKQTMADTRFNQNPEFAEAKEARGGFSDKLKQWGGEEGYGAIAPNWGDIWNRASGKIKQHYWGGAGGQPGVVDKVRSSAASRGVSDSPALQATMGNMGMQEGQDISNMATEQAVKEAQFGEQGRQDWMGWMQQLMGQKPSGEWQEAKITPEQENPIMKLLGQLGSKAMPGLMDMLGGGGGDDMGQAEIGKTEEGAGAGGGTKDEGTDWMGMAKTAAQIAGPLMAMMSDVALKEDIKPTRHALKDIEDMNVVDFKYKSDSKTHIGVIAQELEKICPEAVGESDGFKYVNYAEIVPVLIKAVQELSAKINKGA